MQRMLRSALGGNPFFLISAATMLYGLYLVAIDPQMIREELSKLWFNVSSLEIYELLLVGTALLLARRRLWHDCNQVVTLEIMFMFVPFILISTATLFDDGSASGRVEPIIGDPAVWMVCAVACVFAAGKLVILRQVKMLKLPVSLIVFGMVLIALNVVLPLYYRIGIARDSEAWRSVTSVIWFLVLPLCVVVANLLPDLRPPDRPELSRRNRPLAIPLLWIMVTAVHLRSIDYLDDVEFSMAQLAPLVWAMAWGLFFRLKLLWTQPSGQMRMAFFILPVLVASSAVFQGDGLQVVFILMLVNGLIYAAMSGHAQLGRYAGHLALLSFVACAAAMPEGWGAELVPDFTREKLVILSNAGYLIILATLQRQPGWSLVAAAAFGCEIAYFIEYLDYLGPYAMQSGLLFLLIHSLWWNRPAPHDRAVRVAAALGLVVHSFIWGNIINFRVTDIQVGVTIMLAGLLLIGVWWVTGHIRKEWGARSIPLAGALMIATVPVNYAIDILKVAPKGHLTILASFLIFAIGVAFALTRHRWMKELTPQRRTGTT